MSESRSTTTQTTPCPCGCGLHINPDTALMCRRSWACVPRNLVVAVYSAWGRVRCASEPADVAAFEAARAQAIAAACGGVA